MAFLKVRDNHDPDWAIVPKNINNLGHPLHLQDPYKDFCRSIAVFNNLYVYAGGRGF